MPMRWDLAKDLGAFEAQLERLGSRTRELLLEAAADDDL
jgi:hypothetical protein